MPSRHEPLGNVVLEAWQAKVPVVATRSEGPSWYMVDGGNGVLTDIDDLDPFVAGLQKIKNDPVFAAKMVEGGSAQLENLFSQRSIVDQYLELFEKGPQA
jgi:glycosyltransferase involved in cell wall biosynthesis